MGVLEKVRSATPRVEPENKGAGFLMASMTALVAILAALGVTGGVVGRMARNHEELTGLAFVATAIAVVLGFVAAYANGDGNGSEADRAKEAARERGLLNWGIILYGIAAVLAVLAGLAVWNDKTSPQVTATAEASPRGDILNLTVKSSGLGSDDRLHLGVWPLLSGPASFPNTASGNVAPPQYEYYADGLPLYQSVTGPNADGDVDLSSNLRLPTDHPRRAIVLASVGQGDPDKCFDDGEQAGCTIVDLGASGRPNLAATWSKPAAREPRLIVKSSASEIAGRTVFLRVIGRRANHKKTVLAKAALTPDAAGNLAQDMPIAVPARVTRVCAVASTLRLQRCPPRRKVPTTTIGNCAAAIEDKVAIGAERATKPTQARKRCKAAYTSLQAQNVAWLRLKVP